jgi:hypothetical protein
LIVQNWAAQHQIYVEMGTMKTVNQKDQVNEWPIHVVHLN